ncbi:MAG: hypothetical protein JXA11_02975 [Phycisphaerae bacterium]|nr:hypothetical protein [Phycisphaerae bacterium]
MLLKRSLRSIIVPENDWEKDANYFAVSAFVDRQAEELLLYYLVRFDDEPLRNVLCIARSRDGESWSRPDRGDGTNIIMRASNNKPGWGEFMPATILNDEKESDPGRRWKMLYWDRPDPDMPAGMCLAVSADGLHWNPLLPRPVITGFNDAMSMIQAVANYPIPGKSAAYYIYQQTWKYNPDLPIDRDNLKGKHRRISIWSSGGFGGGWTGPTTILEPDENDAPDTQFYWLTPFRIASGGYGAFLNCHHTIEQTMDVQLVSSEDGWSWKRENDRKPLLDLGRKGQFDAGIVYATAQPVLWKGNVLVFYNGRFAVHDDTPRHPDTPPPIPAAGIGIAEFSDLGENLPLG